MNIKITSESTCDLSKELIAQNNIGIIPLTVIKNDQAYIDGVTITTAEIFAHVAAGGNLCSTTAVSVGEYQEYFEKYSKILQFTSLFQGQRYFSTVLESITTSTTSSLP